MSTLTLSQAIEQRDQALSALEAARRSIGYAVGDRQVRRADLDQLAAEVRRWEAIVQRMGDVAAGVTNSGFLVPKWI